MGPWAGRLAALPPFPPLGPITAVDTRGLAAAVPAGKAPGEDGWRLTRSAAWPPNLLDALVRWYALVERVTASQPTVAAGRPGRWLAQCRWCGLVIEGWHRPFAEPCQLEAAAAVMREGGCHAVVAAVGKYRCSRRGAAGEAGRRLLSLAVGSGRQHRRRRYGRRDALKGPLAFGGGALLPACY